MAMSNWDLLAVNEEGKTTRGVFETTLGVRVEIYKNWLYVQDDHAWKEGGSFIRPTVMEVEHGELRYKDVSIHARRGPQNGVYAVVVSDRKVMIGCGVYGFDDGPMGEEKWVGVDATSAAWFMDLLRKDQEEGESIIDPEVLRKVDLAKAKRFNQGDAYFADVLGAEVPVTAPGEAKEPIMTKLVEDLYGKKEG